MGKSPPWSEGMKIGVAPVSIGSGAVVFGVVIGKGVLVAVASVVVGAPVWGAVVFVVASVALLVGASLCCCSLSRLSARMRCKAS